MPPSRTTTPSAGTSLPRLCLRAAWSTRAYALHLLGPLDYLARVVTDKRHLPPLAVRRYVGPLAPLEATEGEFVAYLKLLCNVSSSSRVLDVGCGFGLVALGLEEFLAPPGKYVGTDINRACIRWAQSAISKRRPNFQFDHLDISNAAYNPKGKLSSESVTLPYEDSSFDCIILKSVFTHLRPNEVQNYLGEISRLLTPGGVCLATFFLLNEEQDRLKGQGKNRVDFRFGDDAWRYAWEALPELAVAYREERLMAMASNANLAPRAIHYGTWSGQPEGLSYQDIVLLGRQP